MGNSMKTLLMCKQNKFIDVKEHLLNIRTNCGPRRCREGTGKQCVMLTGNMEGWEKSIEAGSVGKYDV